MWAVVLAAAVPAAAVPLETPTATREGRPLRDALVNEAAQPGKRTWQPMLLYLAALHGRSVHPPIDYFRYPFEDIGPGYQGGMAFGHIDLTHERLDTVRALPEHARNQIRNELAGQQPDGLIPGVITFDTNQKASWKPGKGFPPLWPVSVDAYVEATADVDFLKECLDALVKQIGWFESKRAVTGCAGPAVGKRHG
jgi:putative isomerase